MRQKGTPDFRRDGKQSLWIDVAAGRGRAPVRIPITIVRRGDGPSVLFTGGCHGDEYEGPVSLMKLAATLEADDLACGTVVIMPMIRPGATVQ